MGKGGTNDHPATRLQEDTMTTQRWDCCGKRCSSCNSNLTAAEALDDTRREPLG
ncbi:hypothetical protein [Tomitella gaofuii]|uniref:hypothetical protein n=1 Tax=Tomitella gaofuii TaxID=2760083 RepID=UPI0015FDA023|nr:hypothetical protein [Tomitella gaofuii]